MLYSLATLLDGLAGLRCVRLPAGPRDTVNDEAESMLSEPLNDPSSCDVPVILYTNPASYEG